MPDTVSSARPARLTLYGRLCGAVADGVLERAGHLDAANDTYLARNDPAFRFDCADVVAAVREVAEVVRALGTWVAEVGIGFITAEAWNPLRDDGHEPRRAADTAIALAVTSALPELQPARRRTGTWTPDRNDPAWWGSFEDLGNGATATGVYAGLLDLPGVANAAGSVSTALTVADAALGEWRTSAALPTDDRIGNTALHAGLTAAGSYGGGAIATAGCAAFAPLAVIAPACGVVGSTGGALLMRGVAEVLDRDPKPGEHDAGAVEGEIADYDPDAVGEALEALDDLEDALDGDR